MLIIDIFAKKGRILPKKSYCINFVAQKHQKSRFLPEKSIFRGFRPPEHVRMAQNGLKIDSTAYIGLYEGGGPHAHWRITPFDFLTVEAQSNIICLKISKYYTLKKCI